MTAGGLAAILMTLFVELTKPRRDRIEAEFDLSVLPRIREFLAAFATRNGWDAAMADRLDAAGEETLVTLVRQNEGRQERRKRRLSLVAYKEGDGAVLEFVAASGEDNIQDQLSMLGDQADAELAEREVSLRPVAALRFLRSPPAISRQGHRHRPRESAAAGSPPEGLRVEPAFLITRRSEVRKRAVRKRRAPLGAQQGR